MPRILYVSLQGSPHTARWVDCVADAGWDLHMFGIDGAPPNPLLRGVTLHVPQAMQDVPPPPRWRRLLRRLLPGGGPRGATATWPPAGPGPARLSPFVPATPMPDPTARIIFGKTGADCPASHGPQVLAELIRTLKPDLIHSMEFQHCGYLVLAARDILGAATFPSWLATNWGSDIYLFGRDPDHAPEIRRLLAAADLYSCECHRDLALAREFGFRGPELPVLPNSGGMDLKRLEPLRDPTPPSRRKLVMVKGYDHFAGRAMVSLAVLERFAERLRGHRIVLFSVGARPRVRALELKAQGVLDIEVIDAATHNEILARFGQARMYLGVSISDAISTSVLEAMAMGAFPIQTDTSCCEEWFEDGVGGFAIPADDFEVICDRFGRALTDDALVDRAAPLNRAVIEARLACEVVGPQVRDLYARALAHVGGRA